MKRSGSPDSKFIRIAARPMMVQACEVDPRRGSPPHSARQYMG